MSRNKNIGYLEIDYCHFEDPLTDISVVFQNKSFSFKSQTLNRN